MTGILRQSRFARALFVALLVLVVGVRAAVPAGYMPTAERGFAVAVCSAQGGTATLMLPFDAPRKAPEDARQDCGMAGAAPAALAPPVMPAPVAEALAAATSPRAISATPARALPLAAPPPPSHAPPARV